MDKLTREQCAVISAYTGYLIGSFAAMQEYIEQILGRPVWTHELPSLTEEIREASRADFIALSCGGN